MCMTEETPENDHDKKYIKGDNLRETIICTWQSFVISLTVLDFLGPYFKWDSDHGLPA